MRRLTLALGAVSLLAFSLFLVGTGAAGNDAGFLATNYYLISIGTVDVPIASLIQTAQSTGYTVIVRSGAEVTSYRGDQPTDEDEAVLLDCDRLLYVDNGLYLLRVRGDDYDYTVRPGRDGTYTLVIVPHRDLPLDTLTDVLAALQGMGVIGSEADMEFTAYPQQAEKSPAPPAGAAIDSRLYAVEIAPDWFSAAAAAGLTRVGLRVEVVAEKLPGGTIPEDFREYIETETDSLAKLLLPISRLVELAQSPGIGYLRPPYRPHPAVP